MNVFLNELRCFRLSLLDLRYGSRKHLVSRKVSTTAKWSSCLGNP